MSEKLIIKAHPVYPSFRAEQVEQYARLHKKDAVDALGELMRLRQQSIAEEVRDPFRCGWEPPVWKLCRALLGLPCWDKGFEVHIRERFGMSWEEWSVAMRAKCGFDGPVKMLLCMGANRSGKSVFNAKTAQQIASTTQDGLVLAGHMSGPVSIQQQHPLYWEYLPPEWQEERQEQTAYIKYKAKTGFSDMSFINPANTWVIFLSYLQDAATALEGKEPNSAHLDELAPPDWVDAVDARLAQRDGPGVFTFTPIHGYTAAVKIWLEGAITTRETISYVLPTDGGEADVARALNLAPDEYDRLLLEESRKEAPTVSQAVPEDVCAWLEEGKSARDDGVIRPFGFGNSQIVCPSNRAFEMVPRVQKCVRPGYGVVYFKPSDNPFGNPKAVIRRRLPEGRAKVRMRLEGLADKAQTNRLPRFDRRVHVLPDDKLPTDGRWYMFLDPATDRNFYMTWFLVTDVVLVWQEWPGDYVIPGVGHPGPWAIPSGKKNGINDGDRGDAQSGFGFGLLQYKAEIARIEGWEDYKKWSKDSGGKLELPPEDEVEAWDEQNGAERQLAGRGIDLRAAGSPRVDRGQVVTLEDDLNEIGMMFDFGAAPKSGVVGGEQKINDALYWDSDQPMSFQNRPSLYVADRCKNTIFSCESWCGADGQKGACKDPIDNVINFYNSGLDDDAGLTERGGFSRGTDYGSAGRGMSARNGRRPKCMDA